MSSLTGIARPDGSGFDRGAGGAGMLGFGFAACGATEGRGAAGAPGLGTSAVLGRGGETEAFAAGAVDGRGAAGAVLGRGAGAAGGTEARADGGGTEVRAPPAGMRDPGGPPTCGGRTLGRALGGGAPAAGRGLLIGAGETDFAGGGASIVGMSSSSSGPCDFSAAQRAHTIGLRETSGRGTREPH
jgi:hypothetical protein